MCGRLTPCAASFGNSTAYPRAHSGGPHRLVEHCAAYRIVDDARAATAGEVLDRRRELGRLADVEYGVRALRRDNRQLRVVAAGRDHFRAEMDAQLHRRESDPSGGPVHQQDVALGYASAMHQRVVGGLGCDLERRALGERPVGRQAHQGAVADGGKGVLGEAAGLAAEGDALAHGPSFYPCAEFCDFAGGLHARGVG
jgi:hypothetical protein